MEMADDFLGGLLAVARADGVVNAREADALRRAAESLGLLSLDEERLYAHPDVTAGALAEAIARAVVVAAPYRTAEPATADEIAQFFLESALIVALADDDLHLAEVAVLREFARGLAADTASVAGWNLIGAEDKRERR